RREAETRAEAERRKAEELKRQQQAAREKAEAERLERERQEQERRQAEEQVKAEQLKAQQEAAEQAKEQKAAAAKASTEAAQKVAKQKVTFDLSGVAAYLPNTHQINTFRKLAEKNSQYLSVENQAALAQALKEEAARQKTELSASFIHDQFMLLLMDVKQTERTFASNAAKAAFEAKSQQEKDKAIQEDIAHNLRGALAGFVKLRESRKKAPATFAFTYASVLRNAVVAVADEIVKFNEEFS
ncbi:MAG TPA: hypothetical protein VES89_12535, partial [Candidatus Competibacteraceae bacterium]|nr:hypothetical protein [Candidatus Competibacteraceae bacterium]